MIIVVGADKAPERLACEEETCEEETCEKET
jgi:hypothetical protein